jgi:hypothetical protein
VREFQRPVKQRCRILRHRQLDGDRARQHHRLTDLSELRDDPRFISGPLVGGGVPREVPGQVREGIELPSCRVQQYLVLGKNLSRGIGEDPVPPAENRYSWEIP